MVKKVGLFLVIYGKTKPLSKRKKAGDFVRSFPLFLYLLPRKGCHERAPVTDIPRLQVLRQSEQKNATRKGTEKSQMKPWAMESGT